MVFLLNGFTADLDRAVAAVKHLAFEMDMRGVARRLYL
jgi:hypothetical protein